MEIYYLLPRDTALHAQSPHATGTTTADSQMSDNHIHPSTRPATKNVDRAGGVPTPRWHVAIVNHNAEHTIARTIAARGIPTYVASQPQLRIWRDGRRHHIDHVVIPSTIFIHCTEPQRRTLLQTTPGLHRFLIDRATATRPRPATIPDQQIQRLRFMLGATDTPVEFIPRPLTPGQHITVIRGPLRGLHAEILTTPADTTPTTSSTSSTISPTPTTSDPSDNTINTPYPPTPRILIRLHQLGCATVAISPLDIQPLPA